MIELNGKRFARNESEFVSSLFNPAGTCAGTYKRHAKRVDIFNPQGERVAVINGHGVLCSVEIVDGRAWYSLADVKIIGRWESYSRQVDECRAALSSDMAEA